MEIYGFLPEGSIDDICLTGKNYWTVVIEYYTSALIKYGNELKAKFRTKYDGKKPKVAVLKEPADGASTPDSDLESVSGTQAKAMEKKNIRQKASAMKEMKRCGIAAMESGAGPGAVVTLKVDYRTHSHAQGLIVIVYDVKKTGGIFACSEHGVITHSGTKEYYWVPVDKYNVVAKKEMRWYH